MLSTPEELVASLQQLCHVNMTIKDFSLPEKAQFILMSERNGCDYDQFCRAAWQEKNLRRRDLPQPKTLQNWRMKFLETGSLERRPYSRDWFVITLHVK